MGAAPCIILIGLRCSGKTTVARLLAERAGSRHADLDHLALKRLGHSSVAQVWKTLGEPAWRQEEAAALSHALADGVAILALGGGAPMIDSVERTLRKGREKSELRIVYLRAQPGTLAQRMAREPGDRPPLTNAAPDQEMELVFAQRDERYSQLADLIIETDELTPSAIAKAIALEFFPAS